MITAQHLSKHFGRVKAVDDISFEVKEGENLVLLGTSGCGKTTTLKMINRLIEPTAGRISVGGADITEQSPEELRRGIGYVLQHNSLFPHYTVAENIAVVPQLLKWDRRKIQDVTEALMNKLQLPVTYLSKYPHELSGGQQQRVNIARALAADPPILLMDEPFGALDTITRTKISRDFSEINEFMGKTIVMVTHDVQEAFLLGDRICLMSEGRVVQSGRPSELLFNPANDFVKEFFSASYLRLALGVIKAGDIWKELGEGSAQGAEPFSVSDDLWSLMEYLIMNKDAETISITNGEGQTRHATRADIFAAVSTYKYT